VQVVVIGGGLAGVAAAVAAREEGAEVALVSQAPGASAFSCGGVDLLPSLGLSSPLGPGGTLRPAGARLTLRQRLERLLGEEPEHTLARMSATADELEGCARFLSEHLVDSALSFRGLDDAPFLLATEQGTLREMDLPPAACRPGDLDDLANMRVGVVGLPDYPGFDPSFVAGTLGVRCDAPDRFVPLLPPLHLGGGRELHPVLLARLLEEGAAERLCALLTALVADLDLTHLMLPPLLGLTGTPGLLARMQETTGLVPFEAVGVSSACPGYRLLHALHEMADAFGVLRVDGRVELCEVQDRRALAAHVVQCAGQQRRLPLDSLVLATGDLYGGGLVWDRWPAESILGLPVHAGPGASAHPQPTRRPLATSLERDPGMEQAAFGAGLGVDERMTPLGWSGEPSLSNVWAAGALLAGHDPGARRGGSGVAWVSGTRAGWAAARAGVGR